MQLWQRTMIGLARSRRVTDYMHGAPFARVFSRRFTGGETLDEALTAADELEAGAIATSYFVLGEYVEDEAAVAATCEDLARVCRTVSRRFAAASSRPSSSGAPRIPPHISVDPTQIGAMQSWDLCRENARDLAALLPEFGPGLQPSVKPETVAGPQTRPVLMLDMEDSSVTQPTLRLYHELRAAGLPVAVTLQTCLYRSKDDLEALIEAGAWVRLVKGAFAESGSIAYTSRSTRDAAYTRAMERMFSLKARDAGARPALGTHDQAMVATGKALAQAGGWAPGSWEVEMLRGVRVGYQRQLAREGVCVRVYLPYGRDFWPYSIRRVGESPRNALFLLRALFGRRDS